MKKKLGIYSSIAEAINDFSLNRLNRVEFYEIMCNCVMEATNDDREKIFKESTSIEGNDYILARNWLIRK